MENSGACQGLTRPIRCIVKLGGAAITCKNELEKINEENLGTVSSQLRQAMSSGPDSQKILGMDWSKRPGESELCCDVGGFYDQISCDSSNFVVVHGAGSFGHFQASKSGVHKGGLDKSLVKAGFVATRISVTTLNLEIVRALAAAGIPSVGMSPFSCGWLTSERNLESADLSMVVKAIESGFVPCLRFGCLLLRFCMEMLSLIVNWSVSSVKIWIIRLKRHLCINLLLTRHLLQLWFHNKGCTILSGDVIIKHLAAYLKPEYVIFLVSFFKDSICMVSYSYTTFLSCLSHDCLLKTDVFGVYDRPPSEPEAVLLREIAVTEEGSWSVVKPNYGSTNKPVEITVAAHDTTGGMVTKIAEAAMIAKLGIDVYIVKAATSHSQRALSGEIRRGSIPDDWLGTVIKFAGKPAQH
ncbi:unnamed protein product [Linum tenue]|uniref:Isopentenyl phosphate kinase n=1 Tax=Linum tenue TaxID=586396 RepID=A0AAV0IBB0_9ROSI|nr:unnamed protein product [Linum tenue]